MSAGGEAEATNDEPFLRRRTRRSTATVKPNHAKAAPKTKNTAGIDSMIEFRPGTARRPYPFLWCQPFSQTKSPFFCRLTPNASLFRLAVRRRAYIIS